MKGWIIDPAKQSIKEVQVPNRKIELIQEIATILGHNQYYISFLYPTEYRTCTAYVTKHIPGNDFFRVRGFVGTVKFGYTLVVDKTALGVPKSDKVTLEEVQALVTFYTGKKRSSVATKPARSKKKL
jgi:hypothetical protein